MKKVLSVICTAAVMAAMPVVCNADETPHDAITKYLQSSAPDAGQLKSLSLLTDKDGRTVEEFSDPTLIHRFYSIKNDDTFTKQDVFSGYSGDFSQELDASNNEWFIPVVENGAVIGVYDISADDPWGIKGSYTPVKDGFGVGMVYTDAALDNIFPADKYGTPTELKSAYIHYPVTAVFMYVKTVGEEYIIPFTDVKIGAYDDNDTYSYSVEFNKLSVCTADEWVERMKSAKADKDRHESERTGGKEDSAQYVDGSGDVVTVTPKPTAMPTAAPTEAAISKPDKTQKPAATDSPTAPPEESGKSEQRGTINVISGEKITVKINDDAVIFPDAEPFIDENERTQIPIRAVAEAMGATVEWNGEAQTATVTREGITAHITIGKNILQIDNKTVQMDTTAEIIDERTYIPLRFVGEALGMTVNWVE